MWTHAPTPPVRPALPWTHHEILALAEPFVRAGHALDLAASDRAQRRLVFRRTPVQRVVAASDDDSGPRALSLAEGLQLESPQPGRFRLARTLHGSGALQATLWAEGPRPEELLQRVQAVPPQRLFHTGRGYRRASSGQVAAAPPARSAAGDAGFRLTDAVVETDALVLRVQLAPPQPVAVAASARLDLRLRRACTALPGDLLAVLGWDWSLLQAGPQGWQGSVRLRGDDVQRKLRVAARHLVRTLAEAPPRFHERLRAARWRVLLRQALPLLACVTLVVEALCADALRAGRGSGWTLASLCVPPALMLLYLLRSEGARIGLPQWPRRPADGAW